MAAATLKCAGCKERFKKEIMIRLPAGNFHSFDCSIEYAKRKQELARKRQESKRLKEMREEERAKREKHKSDKERIKSRKEWHDQLQKLVNQFVLYVRDKDQPCCTCGTKSESIRYDAGHFISRGARPELRFEITNIHKQCAIKCNVHGSGMRAEYRQFIEAKYGSDHLEWLEGPHKSLKDQYPQPEDIKSEIMRYRKMLRDSGLTPRA